MAYDETLAARIRDVIDDIGGEVTERKMFGGLGARRHSCASGCVRPGRGG